MKKLLYLLTLLSFSAFSQENDYKIISEKVLEQFKKHDFIGIRAQMDSLCQTKYDTIEISKSWSNLIAKFGGFVENVSVQSVPEAKFTVVSQRCKFEKNEINFRLIWANNKIKSYSFSQFDTRPKYIPPSYLNTSYAVEKKVLVISGEYRLPGILSIPKTDGKHPLVILVHGSGPNDRDETVGPLKPFKDISAGLNNNGIAVMRYEKRTRLLKVRMKKELPNYTVKEEVLEDLKNAIEIAKQDSSIDSTKIYICGHGFGATLLPRIVKENPSVKGLIFLTPNGRKLEDIYYALAEMQAIEITDTVKKKQFLTQSKNELDNIKALTASAAADSTTIFDSPASYWYDLKNYDPITEAKTVNKPMLFVFGSRDFQTTSVDVNMWQAALKSNKKATFKIYPKLNHFCVAGEGVSTPSEYKTPANVDIGMIKDMATWLNGNK